MNAEYESPYISINDGSPNGVAIPALKSNMPLGRDQTADIVIDDPTVSRKHAEIVHSNDEFVLLDLGSKNGSFVNEVKVGRMGQSLKDGDEIRFGPGHTALVFRENNAMESGTLEPLVTEPVNLSEDRFSQLGLAKQPCDVLEGEVFSGSVRLRAVAGGDTQYLSRWVGRLQRKAHIHMLRAVSISANEMEIMLTVLEPIPLVRVLSEIGGVASVKSGDGETKGSSGNEMREFTVALSL